MKQAVSRHTPLGPKECHVLAEALGDTPETVIPVHLLRRGLARAWVAGGPSRFHAAVVQSVSLPEEPFGFGRDHQAIWDLLRPLQGWRCVDVPPDCAPRLGALIREGTGRRVCYYGDVYHTLTRPVTVFHKEVARQMTLDDLPVLEASGANGSSFGGLPVLFAEGSVAGAIVSGKLVAIALTSAVTDVYADIGVSTDEAWRGRGFATAAASIVAQRVQESGRIPVWSCGEDNMASLRVAQKLGFTGVSRLTYVIPNQRD